jgi:Putative phage tail protein
MPAVVPLIIVAVGEYIVAQGAAYFVYYAAIAAAAAATVAINKSEQRRARRRMDSERRDLQVILHSADEPRRTVYGRSKISGPLVYAVSEGADNKFLHRVIVLTGHEIDAFEKIYFNDDEVALGAALPATADFSQPTTGGRYMENGLPVAHVEGKIGAAAQSAMGTLIAASGGQWTSDHRLQGCAYIRAQTNYTPQVYTEGPPNVSAVIRGKKLYDPRTGLTVWSDNPALVIRDYLVSSLGAPTERIDDASFIAAANVCDEWITVDTAATADPAAWAAYMQVAAQPPGNTWSLSAGTVFAQRRYRINGIITSDAAPGEALDVMVQACAGWISYSGGVWRLVAGSYTAPTLTLGDNDLRGNPSFQPRPPRRDLFNVARGTFQGPLTRYVATDFAPVIVQAFVTADGDTQMPMDLDLPFTNDTVAAQRLATIFLQRSRQGVLTFPATLTALALRPGDTVAINLPRFGFAGQVFRVEGWTLSEDFGVDLVLREDAASIYTWAPDATIRDPSPQLNLPSPFTVPAITGLTATSGIATNLVQNDGTIIQRTLVSWNVTANAFARFVELQTRLVGATEWTPHPNGEDAAGKAYLTNLQTNRPHEIRARRLNTVGAYGEWATINYTPAVVNVGENALRNSDWTQDLGYGSGSNVDARALRNWTSGGNPALYGRNYDSGRAYNIGAGGCWAYIPSNIVGHYALAFQDVAAQPGVEYESSVYVFAARGRFVWVMDFYDASYNYLGGTSDQIDTGAAVVGEVFRPLSNTRLWCKATAPAGTSVARVYWYMEVTANSSPYPFAAWSNAMLCVAPSGVTRETATPWRPEGVTYLRGLGDPYMAQAAGTADAFSSAGYWTFGTKTSLTIDLKAGEVVNFEWTFEGSPATQATFVVYHVSDIVIAGSGKIAFSLSNLYDGLMEWNNNQRFASLNSTDFFQLTRVRQYTAATDQTVAFHAGAGFGYPSAIGSAVITLRVYKVRA